MNPDKQAHFFSLIYGPPGTGKSTLVQEACQEMGRGVGYINISPMSQDFGKYLGETFSFRFERHVNIFNIFSQAVLGRKAVDIAGGMGKLASLERSCKALHEAAIAFRASEGRPFVLVIDSFDRLIHSERDIAVAFLEYAKDWAEDGTIKCVFVANEFDTVSKVMTDHPTQARASSYTVDHISKDEGMLLFKSFGLEAGEAQYYLDLFGGSFILIERVVGLIGVGQPRDKIVSQIRELMVTEVQSKLQNPELAKPTQTTVEALIESPNQQVSQLEWRKLVPDPKLRKKILEGGVFHLEDSNLSFASKLANLCANEVLGQKQCSI